MPIFSFILAGLFGSYLIGRINRSSKVFFICVLALVSGIVAGAAVKEIVKPSDKHNIVSIIASDSIIENGNYYPMLYIPNTSSNKIYFVLSYSSTTSKDNYLSDILYANTPGVKIVHPVRCLSPPSYINTS